MTPGSSSPVPPKTLRVGLLGAGRTRQGLGPFLASAFERAGCVVHAVAGRDRAGAERAAAALAANLHHAVAAVDDAVALARAVDLLVVAAPVPGHLAGLQAALTAGVPCLCEKPLVAAADAATGLACIAAFRARGLPLFENCQWPFVLPALFELHPHLVGQPVRTVAMGLSPAWPGRTMIEDSLSHALSLVQGLESLPADARPANVRQAEAGPAASRNEVTFELPGAEGPIAVSLQLQVCVQQPRPAWFAVNGARIDRRLGADYSHSYVAGDGRSVPVQDPLHQLVHGVVGSLNPSRGQGERQADSIALRLRLYAGVLGALRGA